MTVINEMPDIVCTTAMSNTYGYSHTIGDFTIEPQPLNTGIINFGGGQPLNWNYNLLNPTPLTERDVERLIENYLAKENIMADKKPARRLVQVIIVDPDERLAVENAVLHFGDTKITDFTDQELFFDLEIKSLLKKHNAKRLATVDKKASKSKDVFLDEIRANDLKMVVNTIATF